MLPLMCGGAGIVPRGAPVFAASPGLPMSPLAKSGVGLVIVTWGTPAPTVTNVADTNGATWTQLGSSSFSTLLTTYLYLGSVVTSGPTTVNVTISGSGLYYGTAQEFTSTIGSTWAIDGSPVTVNGSGGNSAAFAAVVPSGPSEMWLAGLGIDDGITPPAGFFKVNPGPGLSLTYQTNIPAEEPIAVTVPIVPAGVFGNDWAGVACLLKVSAAQQPLIPDFMATGAAPTLPFPNSIYTTPIGSNRILAANSAQIVANLLTSMASPYPGIYPNAYLTRYVVHGNQLPTTNMDVNYQDRFPAGPQGLMPVPKVPVQVQSGVSPDNEIAWWDVDNNVSKEFWGWGSPFFETDGNMPCNTTVVVPTNKNWAGTVPYAASWAEDPNGLTHSTDAAKTAYMGTVITNADWLAGAINHMIGIAVGQTGCWVPPAAQYDFTYALTTVPEGTILTWAAGTVKPGNLFPLESMIYDAILNYGLLVMDSTAQGGVQMNFESFNPWAAYNPDQVFPPDGSGSGGINFMGLNWDNHHFWGTNTQIFGTATSPRLPWSSLVALAPMTAASIVNGSTPRAAGTLTMSVGSSGSHSITFTHSITGAYRYCFYLGSSPGMEEPCAYNCNGDFTPVATNTYTTTTHTDGSALVSGTTYYCKACTLDQDSFGNIVSTPTPEVSVVAP